jgi:hypothetical protein
MVTPEEMNVERIFAQGLHAKNFAEVRQVVIHLLANMAPIHKKYEIRWTGHKFEQPFQFVFRKDWKDIAKTPVIKTIEDGIYPFYIALFAALQRKGVNCKGIWPHFMHAKEHGNEAAIREGAKIAASIR